LQEIEAKQIPHWIPPHKMMNVEDDSQPWGAEWRQGRNFRRVIELFTKRNLWALAAIRQEAQKLSGDCRDLALGGLTGCMLHLSRMSHHKEGGGGIMVGTYYLPQLAKERNAFTNYSEKLNELLEAVAVGANAAQSSGLISTQSACSLEQVPTNSVDYIFTDPPYGDRVQYGELNFVWEAWLDLDTHWHQDEIIVNSVRGKSEEDWTNMMRQAMRECYRVLKPGRWLSLCYHDTSEGTWSLVQDLMAEADFIVDASDETLFIDTGQKSYNQSTADKVTKRDLVINFRKPRPGDREVTQVFIPANVDVPTFNELARQIIRNFLSAHPGATKNRIYDYLVSSMVSKGQMEAHNFDTLLQSVAEDVQQPVKDNLFDDQEPDFFVSHTENRWYLKETADQVDKAELVKEDAAAARLEKFMVKYLRAKPEDEGVHYSDLFEQFLHVSDKPRRLLTDWLPEFFVKTPEGTWRPPDDDERNQLATMREAGTLRRIKRFANALIEGVPVRDKDRPGNDRDLLDWLRQCRRAGLYEHGKAIYEKGGLNLANLSEEQQIDAEDNYRICVRRGSSEETKPKRKRRKTQDDDE
jgi:hypothetical protein